MPSTVLHAVQSVGLQARVLAPGGSADGVARPRPRVLVADDDGDQRLLVEIAARRAGCDVVASVADGDAALARTFEERPDLVILDVSMPGTDGLDVCRALRADARTRDLRIVVVSAAVTEPAVAAGLEAGTDVYVAKPFRVRDLSCVISELVAAPAAAGTRAHR